LPQKRGFSNSTRAEFGSGEVLKKDPYQGFASAMPLMQEKRIGFSRWLPPRPLKWVGVSTGCGTLEKACPDTNRFSK
jgi:hypothetical protein